MNNIFRNKVWESIYNGVFCVYPSQSDVPIQITLTSDTGKKVFNHVFDLIQYMAVHPNLHVSSDTVNYKLLDNTLKNEVETLIHEVDDIVKKGL